MSIGGLFYCGFFKNPSTCSSVIINCVILFTGSLFHVILFLQCAVQDTNRWGLYTFSKESFRNIISVKQLGSRSGPTFCRPWSGFKLFAKVNSRWQVTTSREKLMHILWFVLHEMSLIWTCCLWNTIGVSNSLDPDQDRHSVSGTLSECQTVWIQIRTHILCVLSWVQTVCKSYRQMTIVAASEERVKVKKGKHSVNSKSYLLADPNIVRILPYRILSSTAHGYKYRIMLVINHSPCFCVLIYISLKIYYSNNFLLHL